MRWSRSVSRAKAMIALVYPVVRVDTAIETRAKVPASSGLTNQTYSCRTQPGAFSVASSVPLLATSY